MRRRLTLATIALTAFLIIGTILILIQQPSSSTKPTNTVSAPSVDQSNDTEVQGQEPETEPSNFVSDEEWPDNQLDEPVANEPPLVETEVPNLDPHELFVTATPDVSVPAVTPPEAPVEDQAVIVFSPESSQQEREAYLASIDAEVQQTITEIDTVVVNIASANLPPSNTIVAAAPDYYVTALDTANDPYYSDQWALRMIGAPQAWSLIPQNAPSVTVAVIDSGVCLDHPDLAGHILPGYDYIDDDENAMDVYGHGCSVAGIIAANVNNATGIAGVAPNAQILPLRVLDDRGIGTYSDVAAAIVEATDRGAQVINLSLGGVNPSPVMENAVQYAVDHGVTVIAAAGNNGAPQVFYPAAYEPVIAVGSVDRDLRISSFSNYGDDLDVMAPGRDIMTTTMDGGYGHRSGTSFAAPHVSGAAALAQVVGVSLSFDSGHLNLLVDDAIDESTPSPTPTATTTEIPAETQNILVYMANPAAVYCTDLGYEYETRAGDNGEVGICIMPDDSECNQWDFYAGTCGAEYSYCAQQGYALETRADGKDAFSSTYAICIDTEGQELGSVSDLSALGMRAVGCDDEDCLDQRKAALPQQMETQHVPEMDAQNLPTSFDWRSEANHNWLTGIRNQNPCGSCWAFAALGIVEASYNIARGNPHIDLDLSEQYLVSDCFTHGSKPHGLCNGGADPQLALEWASNGVCTEGCLPYLGTDSSCTTQCANSSPMAPTLHSFYALDRVNNPSDSMLKAGLIEHGPIVVMLGVLQDYGGDFDSNSIYRCSNDNQNGNFGINHAVVLVGYNDAGGYWIIRNSWGERWGDGGYGRIGYNECNLGYAYYSRVTHDLLPPSLTSPSNSATTGKQVTFEWNSTVPIRTGYTLRINQSPDPESGPYVVNTSLGKNTTSYTYTFDDSGTYHWHLRLETVPHNSAWVTRSFTADNSFCGQVTQIPASECNALATFYNDMDGPNWNDNSGWGQTITPCDWEGITCSGGHVTGLDLSYNNLSGPLSGALESLSYLEVLSLWSNNIEGSIPSWLGNMTSLRDLQLPFNDLTGAIPWQLGNLSNLNHLSLTFNELSGAIPWQLGNLSNLTFLGLSYNNLEGAIPTQLGDLTNLNSVYLQSNQLTGAIPSSFQYLNPSALSLSYNQLTGEVPSWMGWESYSYLDLSGNNFTMPLPSTFENLTNTRRLYLNNMDMGYFPTWLQSLTQLETLELSGNNITGSIPTWVGDLTNLNALDLSDNQFSEKLVLNTALSNLINLQYHLDLSNNQLSGCIPYWISNFTKLQKLDLSNNQFSCAIPTNIGNLTALNTLLLNHNIFTGEVPYNITYLSNLTWLDIGYNSLSASNGTTHNFLNNKDPDWEATQFTAPGNDFIGNAWDIGDTFPIEFTQDVYGSTVTPFPNDPFDPAMGCVPAYSNTVWYVYTPTVSSQIRVDTTGSTYDTVVAVYDQYPNLNAIACDDDGAVEVQKSLLTFPANTGNTYYIMVADYGSDVLTTNSNLTMQIASDSTPPTVQILSPLAGQHLNQDSITIEAQISLDATSVQFWVQYDPDFVMPTALSAQHTEDIKPYTNIAQPPPPGVGEIGAQVVDWFQLGSGISDGNGIWTATWDATSIPDQSGVDVFVRAYNNLGIEDGWDRIDDFLLDRTAPTGSVTAPLNGSEQSSPWVTLSAEASDGTIYDVSGVSHVLFYQRTENPPASTHWEHLGTDSTYPYAINWDIQGMSEGTVNIDIRVVDFAGNVSPPITGPSFTIKPPPDNDLITSATPINPKSDWLSQDIQGATSFADPVACAPYVDSVWFTFTEPLEREVMLNTFGSAYDTVLAVYSGTESNPSLVTCNNDMYGPQSSVTFTTQPGTTYYVMVGTYGSAPVTQPTTLWLSSYTYGLYVNNAAELIAAIEYANSDPDHDFITLRPGNYDFPVSYDGYNALPTITTSMTINGNGQTLRRTGIHEYRLFSISETGDLYLNDMTLQGGFFTGNEGGAIRNLGNLDIRTSTLQYNVGYWGGAITNWGRTTIHDSNLFYNAAWNGGGAIDNPGGTVTLIRSYVGGNEADWGGGIINWGELNIYEGRLADNVAYYGGGAIRTYGSLSLNWAVVNNNRANQWGGGVSIYNGEATFDSVTFSGNNAFYGGAVHNSIPIVAMAQNEYPAGPDGQAINAAFTDPVHVDRQPEPALRANVHPSINFYASTFKQNYASYGGAVYNYNGEATFDGATFDANRASYEGGAIFNTLYSTMGMTQPRFMNNSAYFSAGAVANSATLTVLSPVFENNQADLYNGGAITNYADLSITGGEFSGNYAADSGGAIFNAAQLQVNSTIFTLNSAYYNGGAVVNSHRGASATVNNATFDQNSTGYNGGAISNWGSALSITGSQFLSNSTSYDGGALNLYADYDGATFSISDTTFDGNTANHGGAIHYHGNGSITSSVQVLSSIFSDNVGLMAAGAIYTDAPLSVNDSCITNNTDNAVVNGLPTPLNLINNWWGLPLGPSYYSNFGDSIVGPAAYKPYTTIKPASCDQVPDADLVAEIAEITRIVLAGDVVDVTFIVRNQSNFAAPGTSLLIMLPPDIVYTSLPSTCAVDGGGIRCDMGTVPALGTRSVTLRLRVSDVAYLTQTIQAYVTSQAPDLLLENNQGVESIQVIPVDTLFLTEQEIFAGLEHHIQNTETDVEFVLVDVTPTDILATVRTRSAGTGEVRLTLVTHETHVIVVQITSVAAFDPAQQTAFELTVNHELNMILLDAMDFGVFDLYQRTGTITGVTLTETGLLIQMIDE